MIDVPPEADSTARFARRRHPRERWLQPLAQWVLALSWGCFWAPGFNTFETPDAATLRQLVEHGTLAFDTPPGGHALFVGGADGRYYSVHEPGTLLAAWPIAWVAFHAARWTGVPFTDLLTLALSLASAVCFAWTVALTRRVAETLGLSSDGPYWLILLAASQYGLYGLYPADVSVCAPVFLATWLASRRSESDHHLRWPLLSGLGCSVMAVLKVTQLAVAPMALVLIATRKASPVQRVWSCAAFALGVAPGFAVLAWWNCVRFGRPFRFGYPPALEFSWAFLGEGLLGTLVGPAKGILWYSPVLLALPWAIAEFVRRREARTLTFVFGSLGVAMVRLAGQASWTSWGGWGIRFYVPWVPFLVVLAEPGWHRLPRVVAGSLLAAGLTVNLSGLVTNYHYRQQLCGFDPWTWRGTNICAVSALPGNLLRTAGLDRPEAIVPGASARNVFVSNRVTTWWYALRTAGVAPAVSWAIALALTLAFLAAWLATRRPGT